MFNKINERGHSFKKRYLRFFLIPAVLFQVYESLGEGHESWFAVKTITHFCDFGAESRKFVSVWLQTRIIRDTVPHPIGAFANTGLFGNFSLPFLNKCFKIALSGSNIRSEERRVGKECR